MRSILPARVRVVAMLTAIAGLVVPVVMFSAPAGATPPPSAAIVINIDHTTPHGRNFGYHDFFPHGGTNVPAGSVVEFLWAANPDGFHNVAVLKSTESPADAWAATPVVVAEPLPDDTSVPPPQLELNPTILLGNQTTGCGMTALNPCDYSGSADVIAPAHPSDGVNGFFVKANATAGTTVNIICLVHPGMHASFNVVAANAPATAPRVLAHRSADQYRVATSAARHAANHVKATYTPQPDGTRLITALAGLQVGPVEVLEMLPHTIHARPGDHVEWQYTPGSEIHTVTFPRDTTQGEPLPLFCEGSPDTPAATAGPPCDPITNFENHVIPQPQGTTVIATPTTFGSSGLIGGGPPPQQFTFSFPNKGTFAYFCHVHDHMVGKVKVRGVDD